MDFIRFKQYLPTSPSAAYRHIFAPSWLLMGSCRKARCARKSYASLSSRLRPTCSDLRAVPRHWLPGLQELRMIRIHRGTGGRLFKEWSSGKRLAQSRIRPTLMAYSIRAALRRESSNALG